MTQADIAIVYQMLEQGNHDRAQKLMWSRIGSNQARGSEIWRAYRAEVIRREQANRMAMMSMASAFGGLFSAFGSSMATMERTRFFSND